MSVFDSISDRDQSNIYWKQKQGESINQIEASFYTRVSSSQYKYSNMKTLLEKETTKTLKGVCKSNPASLFVLLQTAFKVVLCACYSQKGVMIAAPLMKGIKIQESNHVNGIVLYDTIVTEDKFSDLLLSVAKTTKDGYRHHQFFVGNVGEHSDFTFFSEYGFKNILALSSIHNLYDVEYLQQSMKGELAIYVEDSEYELSLNCIYLQNEIAEGLALKVTEAMTYTLNFIVDNLDISVITLIETIKEKYFLSDKPFSISSLPTDQHHLYHPFPLTEIQMAYWLGRNKEIEMGGFSTHGYFEIKTKFDIQRLNKSFLKVINRHPMLRAVVLENGEQCILNEVNPYVIETIDLTCMNETERQIYLEQERELMSHYVFDVAKWPLFDLRAFKLNKNEHLLCMGWDVMMVDGASMEIIGSELFQYYSNDDLELPEIKYSFRDYILSQERVKQKRAHRMAESYWQSKIEDFPLSPMLPVKMDPSKVQTPTFIPISRRIDPHDWKRLKEAARLNKVTVSSVLCFAYAKVLSYWSNQARLGLNLTVFNRSPLHTDVQQIVGDFTSLVMLDIDLTHEIPIMDQIRQLQTTLLLGLQHRHYDGVKFLRDLVKYHGVKSKVMMPIVFTSMLTNETNEGWEMIGDTCWEVYQTPQVYLDNIAVERNGELHLLWNYVSQLFEHRVIETMFSQYIDLLKQIAHETNDQHELCLDKYNIDMIEKYNCTEQLYTPTTLNDLFTKQASRSPHNTAVIHNNKSITFEQLDMMSNQVARYLQKKGIATGDRIGVIAERTIETIVNVIGIIKTGAAYVPIDPKYPEERRSYIMLNSDCKMLLAPSLYHSIKLREEDHDNIQSSVGPEDIAYIIYTSGSTGKPKGVVISHGAVCNTILDINQKFDVCEDDRIIGLSSLCFDLSVYDLFGALSTGAALVIIDDQRDIRNVLDTVKREKVTIWNSVPAILDLALEQINSEAMDLNNTIRLVLLSGDWIPLSLPQKIKRYFQGSEVISLGGATEASIWSIYYPIINENITWKSIPYGMPLANQSFYVLNNKSQICPVGVAGELYIGGIGLADGYFADQEKSRSSFIQHPSLGRIYRTGDYGRLLQEGYIEFLGRKDHQIKIRGYRVELGEISSVLLQHNLISQAVVLDREDSQRKKYLCAYIVASELMDLTDLREYMKKNLPDYMVPQYVVQLEEIPLTPNGKINRNELPDPDYQSVEDHYEAPRDEKERQLTAIWERVLGTNNIGINDNFFEIGGDSIFSIQIIAQANQAGLQLNLQQMLKHQTIAELAQAATQINQNKVEQGEITGDVPLTPIQYWFFEQEHPDFHHWNQSMFLIPRERLDINLFYEALQKIVQHHDALRMRYEISPDGSWKQTNHGVGEEVPLEVISPDGLVGPDWEQRIQEIVQVRQASLNLQNGPLMRAVYFDEGLSSPGKLFLATHHLVVDGVSWRIMLQDLQQVYEQGKDGVPLRLPAKSTSFKTWAEQLNDYGRTKVCLDVKKYWEQQSNKRSGDIPKRTVNEVVTEASTEQVIVVLSKEETSALQDAQVTFKASMNEILLAGLAKAITKWTKTSDLTINVEGHGREEIMEGIDISRTVGWFTSLYPVYLRMENEQPLLEVLKMVKDEIRRIPNKGIDYGILRYLNSHFKPLLERQEKPAISFNYLGNFDQLFSSTSMFVKNLAFNESNFAGSSKRLHIIDVVGVILEEKLHLIWMYSHKHYEDSTIHNIAEQMKEGILYLNQSENKHCAYTVSDFPAAGISKKSLDMVMTKLLKK
ncbi:amino acid adenylation domain-containing protein [Paenibacillus sp. ACRRX]|uniref:non-ribosomal peptide synthetase n=1 Tax=Paenibacillus sp. ACRRX TaxID=2918206 RepID=UPI001EF710A1|nr:non-ribosomal peptide synthetase [Paenibacillus sp. ACRRX]MCG7410807.1 amino acid adenylation domain-containing protein [Paenibacillus sp. ACRRX]